MRNYLVQIFAPLHGPLPYDLIWIILEYANMCRYTKNSSCFYLYACTNPLKFVDRFAVKQIPTEEIN